MLIFMIRLIDDSLISSTKIEIKHGDLFHDNGVLDYPNIKYISLEEFKDGVVPKWRIVNIMSGEKLIDVYNGDQAMLFCRNNPQFKIVPLDDETGEEYEDAKKLAHGPWDDEDENVDPTDHHTISSRFEAYYGD